MWRSRPRILALVVSLGTLFTIAGCSTFQRTGDEGSAAFLARLVNNRNVSELVRLSASPFLLDGEIIPIPSDMATFWERALRTGLRLEPVLVRGEAIGPATWREFGSAREVELWFGRFLPEDARLFELATSDGKRVLLLYRQVERSRTLFGFRGPF